MEKTIKLGRLKLKISLFKKDFRTWRKPWHWQHKALVCWAGFYGMVLNRRLFALSLTWTFNHKGYELYDVEFVPNEAGVKKRCLPYWGAWKVRNKEELQAKVKNYSNEFYFVFRTCRLLPENQNKC